MRVIRGLFVLFCVGLSLGVLARAADDGAARGFDVIKGALVKVWGFDAGGRPVASASGFVVASDDNSSLVLTASHPLATTAHLSVDVDSSVHDIPATMIATGLRGVALLRITRGNLSAVTFTARARPALEGSKIGVAGFLSGLGGEPQAGLLPRVRYPATIGGKDDDGRLLEIANVAVDPGFDGGPVFDPQTGQVLGLIDATKTQREGGGGYAASAPEILLSFLDEQHVIASIAPEAPSSGAKAASSSSSDVADLSEVTLRADAQKKGTVLVIRFNGVTSPVVKEVAPSERFTGQLRKRGYDAILLAAIDPLEVVSKAAPLCRSNDGKGIFVITVAVDPKITQAGLTLAMSAGLTFHADFVACDGKPLWNTTVVEDTGRVNAKDVKAKIYDAFDQAITTALDQFDAAAAKPA